MSDLVLEVFNQNFVRKGVSGQVKHATITEELGQVGEAEVELPLNDTILAVLPNPKAVNPYEGRFNLWEDDTLVFSGIIDATSIALNTDNTGITFGGKAIGALLGFYNLGRRDFLGWDAQALFKEMLRTNIAKEATVESVSTQEELYGAYQLLTGDPFKANYWKSTSATPPHNVVIDLGSIQQIDAIRVMPIWWMDVDLERFQRQNYTVEVADATGGPWTTVATKNNLYPSDARGELYEMNETGRYIRLTVTFASDGYAKIAQLLVYQNIATVGGSTTYTTPFIENDDSGNCTTTGTAFRIIKPGAFQGDGVISHSYVTQLGAGGTFNQRFRGTSSAVFFTSHDTPQTTCDIYVDNVFRQSVTVPTGRYWFKGYDTYEDMGLLSNGVHNLRIEANGNTNIDYFNGLYETSWRPIEDDDPSIAYLGSWVSVQADYYHNYFAAKSAEANNEMHFVFKGDRVRLKGEKGPGLGTVQIFIDGVSQGNYSFAQGSSAHKQVLFDWSGSYGTHRIALLHLDASPIFLDRIEGNFAHTMYIRSRYETNLKVLIRMSEILDAYCVFNNTGTVDLLGNIGVYGGTIIREGENEGGSIINASVENDYSETGSVCLALVNVNGELPIKAMVIDREALAEIGYKVIKLENSDAADQFLLNRQALTFLREHRKPIASYDISFDADGVGNVNVGDTTKLYSPSANLDGEQYRVGKITTEYSSE